MRGGERRPSGQRDAIPSRGARAKTARSPTPARQGRVPGAIAGNVGNIAWARGGEQRAAAAYAIIMKKRLDWSELAAGAVVRPKASVSVSKHCVPVQTVLRCRVSSTSCTPGRCGPFWQTQFIRSSHDGILPCTAAGGVCWTTRPAMQ